MTAIQQCSSVPKIGYPIKNKIMLETIQENRKGNHGSNVTNALICMTFVTVVLALVCIAVIADKKQYLKYLYCLENLDTFSKEYFKKELIYIILGLVILVCMSEVVNMSLARFLSSVWFYFIGFMIIVALYLCVLYNYIVDTNYFYNNNTRWHILILYALYICLCWILFRKFVLDQKKLREIKKEVYKRNKKT